MSLDVAACRMSAGLRADVKFAFAATFSVRARESGHPVLACAALSAGSPLPRGRTERLANASPPVLFDRRRVRRRPFRAPQNEGCGAPRGAAVTSRAAHLSVRGRLSALHQRRLSVAGTALSAAIHLPEEPDPTPSEGTVRASGKANGVAPSASSWQEVLVPPGGAPASPGCETANLARGCRYPSRFKNASRSAPHRMNGRTIYMGLNACQATKSNYFESTAI